VVERKPFGMSFESWIDRQIREAAERGEFDNLPGAGKPLPGADRPHDENWWVKDYLRREGVSTEALLPPSLQLRREIERLPEVVADLRSEREVREHVAEVNQRIVEWMRAPSGPHVRVAPVNVDAVVAQWRAARPARPAPAEPPPRRRRWFRRS
jgi:hypothetical protein